MDKVICKNIDELISKEKTVLVAIEGACTSGKTTLADEFKEIYDCNIFHIDDFFLPFDMRNEERMNEIGGNVHYERFSDEVLSFILKGTPFSYGKFDCKSGTLAEKIFVQPKKLNIVEGVYSMHPKFGDIYDLKIFLKISKEEQIERLKLRSPEKLQRFLSEWIPKENAYFEKFGIKQNCDIVL